MVTDGGRTLRRTAAGLARRLQEAIGAPVLVLDPAGAVLAGDPGPIERDLATGDVLRLAARLAGVAVEVMIGRPPDGSALAGHSAQALVAVTAAHVDLLDEVSNQEDLTNRLLLDLIQGSADPDAAPRQAELLGIDLLRPRAVVLVDISDSALALDPHPLDQAGASGHFGAARARRVVGAIDRFFAAPSDVICGYIGAGEILLLKERDADGPDAQQLPESLSEASWDGLLDLKRTANDLLSLLRREVGADVAVGVGRFHTGIAGLRRSYHDARTAVRLGRRFRGREQPYTLDGLGVEGLVAGGDDDTRSSLAARLLAPLEREPELWETLDVFFAEDCHPSGAAQRLAIHRNTLGYRLDKIAAMTGLDPRRFNDSVQLRLALVLRAVGAEPPPLCSRPTISRSVGGKLAPRPMQATRQIS